MNKIYRKPTEPSGAIADVIPYCENGVFHLFYLYDHRNRAKYGDGISWYKMTTRDFVHFTDEGEIIPCGKRGEPDSCAFTGGIIAAGAQYHIFYTGHNAGGDGDQTECVMHAVSDNLTRWRKIPSDTFGAPEGYDARDFRDPFVYREENGRYAMLLCARPLSGRAVRKGQTIKMTSYDLKKWDFNCIFYAPQAYHTHECPDLFRIGEWWYLVFSEYSDDYVTRYRMSRSPDGPWLRPADDAFDGRAYYAAKTASDGSDRYLFGWIPTRTDNRDDRPWMWGGNLAVHLLGQNDDGTLRTAMPPSVRSVFLPCRSVESFRLFDKYDCGEKILAEKLPSCYKLGMRVTVHSCASRFGLLLDYDAEKDRAFSFVFDLNEKCVRAGAYPRFPAGEYDGYRLRRPLPDGREFTLELIKDEDIFTLYVNDSVALSARNCGFNGESAGIFAEYADIECSDVLFCVPQNACKKT